MNIDTQNPDQHIADFENNLAESTAKPWQGTMQPQTDASEEEMLRTTCPISMVQQVEKRIDTVSKLLQESRGFNKATGKRDLVIPEGHPRRRALEIEKHQLEQYTLPATKVSAADIAARKAALPTVDDRMRAEADRQQRIQAAAVKRAEEIEVEEAAKRLLAQRRSTGFAG